MSGKWEALTIGNHMQDLRKMAHEVMQNILFRDPVDGKTKVRPGVSQAQVDECKRIWSNASRDYARLAESVGELQGLIDDIREQEQQVQRRMFSAAFAENYLESRFLRAVCGVDQQQYVSWCRQRGIQPKNLR